MTEQTEDIIIDPQEVEKAFLDCLYKEEEIKNIDRDLVLKDAITVEGITHKIGFHPDRLEEKRNMVTEWLNALPHQFHKNSGGGWSFLNACNQENGVQWTGLHQRMEQLFCLGIGLNLVKSQLPREMWEALPGGMPYYAIDTEIQPTKE